MRHLIKQQIIEISLQQGLNHFRVQQLVSDRYWNEIVPMLEKAFDALGSEDELIEIDRFELDLGVVSVKEIENGSWVKEISKRIEEKITAISDPASSKYAIRSRDRRLGVFGQWAFYMEHGYLPWNAGQLNDRWYQDVLEAIAVDIKSHQVLLDKMRQLPFFLERVISQHPGHFLQKLVEILTAKKQEDLAACIDELLLFYRHLKSRNKITGDQEDRQFTNRRWQWILRSVSGKSPHPDEQGLTASMIRSFVNEYGISTRPPASLAKKMPHAWPSLRKYLEELPAPDLPAVKKREPEISPADKDPISSYNSRLIDEEGIFVVNAGAVLLHPFLQSIFSRLDLVNGGAFIDKRSQVASIGLIHYMATGRVGADEYELTLAKILCAFPLEEPIEIPGSLPPGYLQEANNLLQAVIAQWTILQNTTIEGLREGFLQRSGKLFSKNGTPYLQVEKRTIDLLLDHLPWNLGIIKLPWLQDLLRVEWR